MRVIFETRFGSHLYGTDTPSSDVDTKVVYLPVGREILLGSYRDSFQKNDKPISPSCTQRRNLPGESDAGYSTLQKTLAMIMAGKVDALDMLFATPLVDAGDLPGTVDAVWIDLYAHREHVLSSKAQSYVKYCADQANKYAIRGSRAASAEKVARFFNDASRALPLSAKASTLRSAWLDQIEALPHCQIVTKSPRRDDVNSPDIEHYSCCGQQAPLTASIGTALEIFTALWNRYGQRVEQARTNENVDWKAMSHAVRVGHQALELLRTSHITFPRPEADYLKQVKAGAIPFEIVATVLDNLMADVEAAATSSSLPAEANHRWADDFIVRVHYDEIQRSYR